MMHAQDCSGERQNLHCLAAALRAAHVQTVGHRRCHTRSSPCPIRDVYACLGEASTVHIAAQSQHCSQLLGWPAGFSRAFKKPPYVLL